MAKLYMICCDDLVTTAECQRDLEGQKTKNRHLSFAAGNRINRKTFTVILSLVMNIVIS